jgi:hypothetical protein
MTVQQRVADTNEYLPVRLITFDIRLKGGVLFRS